MTTESATTYHEPARELPITRDVDVIVVGGGPAGLAAAISSARNGASTVPIEREYKLTAEDAIKGRRFDDVVAISSCATIRYFGYRRHLEHEGYDIPYRCLLPKRVEGLLIAGRCISSEQQPHESHRAMIPIMAFGEAAGTAAALSAEQGVAPRELDVTTLQDTLIAHGAELRK